MFTSPTPPPSILYFERGERTSSAPRSGDEEVLSPKKGKRPSRERLNTVQRSPYPCALLKNASLYYCDSPKTAITKSNLCSSCYESFASNRSCTNFAARFRFDARQDNRSNSPALHSDKLSASSRRIRACEAVCRSRPLPVPRRAGAHCRLSVAATLRCS